MVKEVTKSKHIKKRPSRAKLIAWAIVAVLLVANDLFLFGGNIKFYAKWVECGQKPVSTGITFVGRVPNYITPPSIEFFRLQPKYFCTPLQAEQAGYSASPHQYEFKYLPKDQWDDARANLGR